MRDNEYDVIVVGGGHAGCEAGLAAAKLGCRTLILTMSVETVGSLSCNPAIGGLAKGQLVKEIGALGGCMADAADFSAIQFRTLNTSKGPAVRSTRAQIDRRAYRSFIRSAIGRQDGLDIYEGMAEEILAEKGAVKGVRAASGEAYYARAVIITTGTFLNGLIHIGLEHFPGGRIGEKNSSALSKSIRDLGITLGRLKTGTCARLDARTIDFPALASQNGDPEITPFSSRTTKIAREQLPCYITYTNERTHEIIRSNLDRSPLFTGIIKGTGARYCPSIEDKVYRFPGRTRHHIFLEPDDLDTMEYYPNGISTSLPIDVQQMMINSVAGLEKSRIVKPGYGIEYDYADPTQLTATLETKALPGLYLAGQINGTTGYEEAAALGLMAGINGALNVKGKDPFVLNRSQAYIGVLIDDLVTKGTAEPYRMFTSRVEYRLILREDNAALRLMPLAYKLGMIGEKEYLENSERSARIDLEVERLRCSGRDKLLRRPGVYYKDLEIENRLSGADSRSVEIEIKYEGYIKRQTSEIRRMDKIERIRIPDSIDYGKVHGLSLEIMEKLRKITPANLAQASRISGVTPAAISILMVYLAKGVRPKLSRTEFGSDPFYTKRIP